jgi:hypothetical protein
MSVFLSLRLILSIRRLIIYNQGKRLIFILNYSIKMDKKDKIKQLTLKYNDILLESIRIALSEDLINLIVVNQEDQDFGLVEFMSKKKEFKNFVLTEFLKNNSNPVIKELAEMEERQFKFKKKIKK